MSISIASFFETKNLQLRTDLLEISQSGEVC